MHNILRYNAVVFLFQIEFTSKMKSLFKLLPLFALPLMALFNPEPTIYLKATDGHGPWKLISDKGDLKIYKRTREGTNLKEVRIDNVFHVSAERMVQELNDVDGYTDWIYKCGEAKVIERPSDSEIIYYTLANVPSPIWDRDIVAHSKYVYYPEKKTHFFESTVPDDNETYEAVRKKVVRVKDYGATWTIKEVGPQKIETINTIYMDPGGSIPAWLANMTISKGPTKSMRALEAKFAKEKE